MTGENPPTPTGAAEPAQIGYERTTWTVVLKPAIQRFLAFLNRPLAAWRFRSAVARSPRPLKINFGCGKKLLPGWINTDVGFRARLYLNAASPWPVPASSASHVYADNVIEHFDMPAARAVLRNAAVVLMPGGRIRLATPDIERTARMYLERGENARAHLERHRKVGLDVYHHVDLLRTTFQYFGHETGYLWDFESLAAELEAAGFVNVVRRECLESPHAEFQNVENRGLPTEILTTLVVEAERR
jgi:predicted SAM-dependent methyltransferase